MRTEKELAKLALDVQDACNLSGVVQSFADAMTDLWAIAVQRGPGHGTDWVNTHPVSVLFTDKLVHLSQAYDQGAVHRAYNAAMNLVESK